MVDLLHASYVRWEEMYISGSFKFAYQSLRYRPSIKPDASCRDGVWKTRHRQSLSCRCWLPRGLPPPRIRL